MLNRDFLEWFVVRLVIIAFWAALLGWVAWKDRWSYDECLRVGHSKSYCTVEHFVGAH